MEMESTAQLIAASVSSLFNSFLNLSITAFMGVYLTTKFIVKRLEC